MTVPTTPGPGTRRARRAREAAPSAPTVAGLQAREDALWAALPSAAWRRSPAAGLMLSDGGWLRAVPGAGLAVPVLAAVLGAWHGALRPGDQVTYSWSLPWMLAALALSLLGCGVALWLWAGFVVADALLYRHPAASGSFLGASAPTPWDLLTHRVLPDLLGYLLLAVLLLATPLSALVLRGAARGLAARASGAVGTVAPALAAAAGAGVQAYAWSQAYPLLARPEWTWRGGTAPQTEAIVPVQQNGWWFAAVAAVVAALVAVAAPRALAAVRGSRPGPAAVTARRELPPTRAVAIARALLRAAAGTLLLGGLIETWLRGSLVLLVLAAAFVVQAVLAGRSTPGRWWLAHVPLGVRLLLATGLAWAVAWAIGRRAVVTTFGVSTLVATDFAPLLWGAVAGVVVAALVLPAEQP